MGMIALDQTLSRPAMGAVRLNTDHPLAQGLVFLSIDGSRDLVTDALPSIAGSVGNSIMEPRGAGIALASSSDTLGGWKWDIPHSSPVYKITSLFSMWFVGYATSFAAWAKFVVVPYRDSASWTAPFVFLEMSRYSSSTSLHIAWATTPTTNTGTTAGSDSGIIAADSPLWLGAARINTGTSGAARFWKDGKRYGADKNVGSSLNPTYSTPRPVHTAQRTSQSNGEGYAGYANAIGIWNRVLADSEWDELYRNRYALVDARYG